MSQIPCRRIRSEDGLGLVALIVSLLVIGGLSVLVVHAMNGSSRASTSLQSGGSAAAASVCRVDYDAITHAVEAYTTFNGHPPASMTQLSQYLRDPVTSSQFVISLDPFMVGKIDVATPGHPAAPGDANCEFAGT